MSDHQAHDLDEHARKLVLIKLIEHRRQIEDLIRHLMGDRPEYRRFVDQYNNGAQINVRELRDYDVGPTDPRHIAELHGIDLDDDDGEAPDWFKTRFGPVTPSG